jgi:hypothetical protein
MFNLVLSYCEQAKSNFAIFITKKPSAMKKALSIIIVYVIAAHFNFLYSQQLPTLDLVAAIDNPTKIVLSDFISDLTYVKLETTPDCLINANPNVKLLNNLIIITTPQQCLVFDRKSGAFIREIGRYGRGPGEYRSASLGFLDEPSSLVYFMGWNGDLQKYSINGKFLGSLPIPDYNGGFEAPSMPDRYTYLDKNSFVCNFMNINGNEKKSLMIISNKGEIVKIIPNRNLVKNVKTAVNTGRVSFHHFNNSTFYQEFYNDSVFKISSGSISPYLIIKRGKYRPPYESLWWPIEKSKQANLILQPRYLEASRFLIFDFNYIFSQINFFALYDKASKSLKITANLTGIKNDFDGFVDLSFKSINEKEELSCLIQSQDAIKWFDGNKATVLQPEIQKLKSIGLGDNPIVVIAKFKQ